MLKSIYILNILGVITNYSTMNFSFCYYLHIRMI